MKRKPYRRIRPSDGAVFTFMTSADGYAMVRRPSCMPFVVPVKEWNSWSEEGDAHES